MNIKLNDFVTLKDGTRLLVTDGPNQHGFYHGFVCGEVDYIVLFSAEEVA